MIVVILITAFCYSRVNSVSEHAASLKPLLKFSTFLLVGILLNAIGLFLPLISLHVASFAREVALAVIQSTSVILLLSIIPTPILVLVYFKPVRALMKQCFLCVCSNVGKKTIALPGQRY